MIPFKLLRLIVFVGTGLIAAIGLWIFGSFLRQLFQKSDPIMPIAQFDEDLENAIRKPQEEDDVLRRPRPRPPAA